MKLLLAVLFFCFAITGEETFARAQQRAVKEQKLLLLIFSGSDWCRPCIQLKTNVLDSEAFTRFADSALVVFVADLPRNQNLLTAAQQQENKALAAQYNAEGQFPHLVLFAADGQIIKSKSGGFATAESLITWVTAP